MSFTTHFKSKLNRDKKNPEADQVTESDLYLELEQELVSSPEDKMASIFSSRLKFSRPGQTHVNPTAPVPLPKAESKCLQTFSLLLHDH